MSSLLSHSISTNIQSMFWIFIIININLNLSLNISNLTQSPSALPSISPSTLPSISPTTAFPTTAVPTTLSPSISPTEQTDSPSNAPSSSPTTAPTASPTRRPTSINYPYTIHIDYNLTNITRNISQQLYNQTVVHAIEQNIEASYLLYSRKLIDDESQYLHFKDFYLLIGNVVTKPDTSGRLKTQTVTNPEPNAEPEFEPDPENIDIRTNYSALLDAEIYYINVSIGTDIRFISKQEGFRNFTQYRLQRFFNYPYIHLIISKPFEEDNSKTKLGDINPFFVWLVVIGIICVSLGTISFIYNNWIPNSKTDNGNSLAVPLYGLQLVDLFTDFNLAVEMLLQLSTSQYHPRRISLYIATAGVLIFTIVPYVSNMILAVGGKNIGIIKKNPYAKSYFQTKSWFFIVLVVFSGGVYPALSIVSSRLFGFEFLNSGLTAMELTKLTKIRLYFTILSENIPQVCCSMLYIHYSGTPSSNTILSLIMSILQILQAVLNYIAMRIPNDCHVIQYDLEMRVGAKLQSQFTVSLKRASTDTELISYDEDDIDEEEAIVYDSDKSTLTKKQKQQIRDKKERKCSLRRWICTELSLRLNAVEVGFVTLTPKGCIVHMIHYAFESEAVAFQKQMLLGNNSVENKLKSTELNHKIQERERWKGDEKSFKKTAKSFLADLFRKNSTEIECAFANHFGLKPEEIIIIFHSKYHYSSWAIANKANFSYAEMGGLSMSSMTEAKFSKLQRNASTSEDERDESKTFCSKTVSIRSEELQQGMDEMQILTKKIKDGLVNKHEDEVREELLEEGYDGELIDKLIRLGKLMANVMIQNNKESNSNENVNDESNKKD